MALRQLANAFAVSLLKEFARFGSHALVNYQKQAGGVTDDKYH
jgi:hypothetical protein